MAISFIVIGTIAAYLILCYVGGQSDILNGIHYIILFDALVFILNVLGQILMSLAYMEQWFVWILVNIFSILLWLDKSMASSDTSYTVVMVIKYAFYFINSVNGLRIWRKLSSEKAIQ